MATSQKGAVPSDPSQRPRTLSKSDFNLARSCDGKLYFRENGYPDSRAFDPYLMFLAEAGYMAEALAKAKYHEGIQLDYGSNSDADLHVTLEHLTRNNVTLFEATLRSGRRLARADVLEKRGNIIRLIEVKAKSIDGAEHQSLLRDGGKGLFWTKRKNPAINAGWRAKLEDLTFQVLILERMLPGVTVRPSLALIDKSKRATIDSIPSLFEIVFSERPDGTRRLQTGRYTGDRSLLPRLELMIEIDASEEVNALRDEVNAEAERFEGMLDRDMTSALNGLQRGSKCASCEFRDDAGRPSGFHECWGLLAQGSPHFLDLYKVGTAHGPGWSPLAEWMWSQRKSELIDVPIDALVKKDGTIGPDAERQRLQVAHTRSRQTFIGPSLRRNLESLRWPAHFIDFETSRLALPGHVKMRPYGVLTFQWSCHTVSRPGGDPVHSEWLNTVDLWPNQTFAESLRAAIGNTGAVVTWSPFEKVTLRHILADLAEFGRDTPDLVAWLESVEQRIVDLHDWAKNDFYHPDMKGSTSIKVVIDALWKSDRKMRDQFEQWTGLSSNNSKDPYSTLATISVDGAEREVRDGTGAMRAYDAMMYGPGRNDSETVNKWSRLLKQYCGLDTLSMVLIYEYWRRATKLA